MQDACEPAARCYAPRSDPASVPVLQDGPNARPVDLLSCVLSFLLLKLLCRQEAARVALLLARDDHVREGRPPAEAPRGVLSRDGHGGDPPQKRVSITQPPAYLSD